MSHIFISYARNDKAQLDRVVAWLKEKDFADKEIWIDENIEGGSDWSNEISNALDTAFAVLVILTQVSAKSQYCTIEWSYALGQGIPVLPLQVEEVNFTDVPPPLRAKQGIKAIDNIPDELAERFRRLRSTSPEVYTIDNIIFDTIFETHRRLFILHWLSDELLTLNSDGRNREFLSHFVKEASEAKASLEKLMLEKAFVLKGKQHRLCWQLVDFLRKIARIQVEYQEALPPHISEGFDTEWMPAFNFFDAEGGWWDKWRKNYFSHDLDDEYNKQIVLVEIVRAFPMMEADDANILIYNMNVRIKRATK